MYLYWYFWQKLDHNGYTNHCTLLRWTTANYLSKSFRGVGSQARELGETEDRDRPCQINRW